MSAGERPSGEFAGASGGTHLRGGQAVPRRKSADLDIALAMQALGPFLRSGVAPAQLAAQLHRLPPHLRHHVLMALQQHPAFGNGFVQRMLVAVTSPRSDHAAQPSEPAATDSSGEVQARSAVAASPDDLALGAGHPSANAGGAMTPNSAPWQSSLAAVDSTEARTGDGSLLHVEGARTTSEERKPDRSTNGAKGGSTAQPEFGPTADPSPERVFGPMEHPPRQHSTAPGAASMGAADDAHASTPDAAVASTPDAAVAPPERGVLGGHDTQQASSAPARPPLKKPHRPGAPVEVKWVVPLLGEKVSISMIMTQARNTALTKAEGEHFKLELGASAAKSELKFDKTLKKNHEPDPLAGEPEKKARETAILISLAVLKGELRGNIGPFTFAAGVEVGGITISGHPDADQFASFGFKPLSLTVIAKGLFDTAEISLKIAIPMTTASMRRLWLSIQKLRLVQGLQRKVLHLARVATRSMRLLRLGKLTAAAARMHRLRLQVIGRTLQRMRSHASVWLAELSASFASLTGPAKAMAQQVLAKATRAVGMVLRTSGYVLALIEVIEALRVAWAFMDGRATLKWGGGGVPIGKSTRKGTLDGLGGVGKPALRQGGLADPALPSVDATPARAASTRTEVGFGSPDVKGPDDESGADADAAHAAPLDEEATGDTATDGAQDGAAEAVEGDVADDDGGADASTGESGSASADAESASGGGESASGGGGPAHGLGGHAGATGGHAGATAAGHDALAAAGHDVARAGDDAAATGHDGAAAGRDAAATAVASAAAGGTGSAGSGAGSGAGAAAAMANAGGDAGAAGVAGAAGAEPAANDGVAAAAVAATGGGVAVDLAGDPAADVPSPRVQSGLGAGGIGEAARGSLTDVVGAGKAARPQTRRELVAQKQAAAHKAAVAAKARSEKWYGGKGLAPRISESGKVDVSRTLLQQWVAVSKDGKRLIPSEALLAWVATKPQVGPYVVTAVSPSGSAREDGNYAADLEIVLRRQGSEDLTRVNMPFLYNPTAAQNQQVRVNVAVDMQAFQPLITRLGDGPPQMALGKSVMVNGTEIQVQRVAFQPWESSERLLVFMAVLHVVETSPTGLAQWNGTKLVPGAEFMATLRVVM